MAVIGPPLHTALGWNLAMVRWMPVRNHVTEQASPLLTPPHPLPMASSWRALEAVTGGKGRSGDPAGEQAETAAASKQVLTIGKQVCAQAGVDKVKAAGEQKGGNGHRRAGRRAGISHLAKGYRQAGRSRLGGYGQAGRNRLGRSCLGDSCR